MLARESDREYSRRCKRGERSLPEPIVLQCLLGRHALCRIENEELVDEVRQFATTRVHEACQRVVRRLVAAPFTHTEKGCWVK